MTIDIGGLSVQRDAHTHDFTLSLFHPYSMYRNTFSGCWTFNIHILLFRHGMGSCIEWMHDDRVKKEKVYTRRFQASIRRSKQGVDRRISK